MSKTWDTVDQVVLKLASIPAYPSAYDGFSDLEMELSELWQVVRTSTPPEDVQKAAVRMAAKTLRFILDVCPVRRE